MEAGGIEMSREIEKQVELEEYLLETNMDKEMALGSVIKIIAQCTVKLKELQGKIMVDGIKEDLVHNIKQQLRSAMKWLEEYDKCVDCLLDVYGWN
tara:strand:- start:139 stop:426 length:288 start_codon:yes stop_codon:yes gene_type:complete